jgi:hypothetical protein
MQQKLLEIPFLRCEGSAIPSAYYKSTVRPTSNLTQLPVKVVRPKPVFAGKENQPITRHKLDNPEENYRRPDDKCSERTSIVSSELMSCMDYPPRFAQFINHSNKFHDSSVRVLRPIAAELKSNKLCQSS